MSYKTVFGYEKYLRSINIFLILLIISILEKYPFPEKIILSMLDCPNFLDLGRPSYLINQSI